jgi:hypothetical protein
MDVALGVTETVGVDGLDTVIVRPLEFATDGTAHAAFDVITQLTTSLLLRELLLKVALLVPAFTLFTFH